MLSLYAPTQDHERNVTGESTFFLDRLVAPPWDVLVEYEVIFVNVVGRASCCNSRLN